MGVKISKKLQATMTKYGQFPYGRRDRPYQGVAGVAGIRDMTHRFSVMKLPDNFEGLSVLDLGCSIGAVCFEASRRGATRVVGLDYKRETVDVARQCAEEMFLPVEFAVANLDGGCATLSKLIGDEPFDYVFCLSIWNHVNKNALRDIIKHYCRRICWVEGHGTTRASSLKKALTARFKSATVEFLGNTTDRSKRPNFKLCF